jgi:hypothetical protein
MEAWFFSDKIYMDFFGWFWVIAVFVGDSS